MTFAASFALFVTGFIGQSAPVPGCSEWTRAPGKPVQGISLEIQRCTWERGSERVFVRARNGNAHAVAVLADLFKGPSARCYAGERDGLIAAVRSIQLKPGAVTDSDFGIVPAGSPVSGCVSVSAAGSIPSLREPIRPRVRPS